jgi:hypothetical protein
MQARFPGICRDCGNRFPAGTDIDWQKGQGASCCNGTRKGTMFPATQEQAQEWQEYFGKQPMVVDGAQRMEWVDGKTTQEVVGFQGDSLVYEQKEYSGYSWMCLGCRLVWERQHQAVGCKGRQHVTGFEQSYGGTVWDGRGMLPAGGLVGGRYLPGTGTIYVRTAIRREESPDAPPVAPAPVPQVEEPAPQVTGYDPKVEEGKSWSQVVKEREIRECRVCTSVIANHRAFGRPPQPYDCTLCECCEEKPAPQDMTSDQLWESMGPGTITTTWN